MAKKNDKALQGSGRPYNNIVDYAAREFATFDVKELCEVDSLVLSFFSYLALPDCLTEARGWDGMRIADTFRADLFDELYGHIWDVSSSYKILAALAANPRFRDLRVKNYVSQTDINAEEQFAAVTIELMPNLHYVAFRGTDSTLVGWKEDFNMAFQYPVPSQQRAAEYLDDVAAHVEGKLICGGHSKGGNLAVYAAMNCSNSTRERLTQVYSHDGPGFIEGVFEDGGFTKIESLVHKTVPQSSLVGMLLEHQEDYQIVKSGNVSVLQHDPFSWMVEDGHFIHIDKLTPGAKYMDLTLNKWAQSLSIDERKKMIDSVYSLLDSIDLTRVSEVQENWMKVLPKVLDNLGKMDPETRDFLLQVIKDLIAMAGEGVPEFVIDRPAQNV